jgi:hypothetical protein
MKGIKIVIRNGYQYFDLGDGNYALVMDTDGEPLRADDREWVETETEWVLYPKVGNNTLH